MREAVGQIFRIDGRAKKGHGGDDGGEGHDLAHVVRALASDTWGTGDGVIQRCCNRRAVVVDAPKDT